MEDKIELIIELISELSEDERDKFYEIFVEKYPNYDECEACYDAGQEAKFYDFG